MEYLDGGDRQVEEEGSYQVFLEWDLPDMIHVER